jgi:hypothetical protein
MPYTPFLAPTPIGDEPPFLPSAEVSQVAYIADLVALDNEVKRADEALLVHDEPSPSVYDDSNVKELLEGISGLKVDSNIRSSTLDLTSPRTKSGAMSQQVCCTLSEPIFPRSSSPDPLFDPDQVCIEAKDNNVMRAQLADAEFNSPQEGQRPPESFFDDAFHAIVSAKAEEVEEKVAQEKFQSHGNNARLLVPCMDFNMPAPDWAKKQESPQEHIGRLVADRRALPWNVADKMAEGDRRKLRWTPFPASLRRIRLDTEIPFDNNVRDFFTGYESPQVSNLKAQKPGGTRVLKCLEQLSEDEEISPLPIKRMQRSTPESPLSEDYLSLRKRKRPHHAEAEHEIKRPKASGSTRRQGKATSILADPTKPETAKELLSSYLMVHAPQKTSPTFSPHFGEHSAANMSPGAKEMEEQMAVTAEEPTSVRKLAPSPQFKIASPGRFIISLDLGRSLVRRIEAHYPGVELLDRDYKKHDKLLWSPGSVLSRSALSPLSFEADICVSPATGMIVTTLAKCRQKPLPDCSVSLRERIARVSKLYERLIVVVSEATSTGDFCQKMCVDDTRAYTDFVAFATALEPTIRVVFVGGGLDTLARWLVALMCKHNHETENSRHAIVAEQTNWEKFLRLSGMNICAAQVVMAALNDRGGLSAFLLLTAEQRMELLEALLRGKGVLQRVGTVLDRKWGTELE